MPSNTKKSTQNKNSNRTASISRETKETQIQVTLDLDGNGKSNISTNIAFLDHMLELLTRHSGIDLDVTATGDLDHHTTEDLGITLGQALLEALGDKKGIRRYGDKTIPMDETLAMCALDLGGRSYHHLDLKLEKGMIEDSCAEDLIHFFESLTINARINLHLIIQYGTNEHHKAEAAFKAFAHALKEAIEVIDDKIPSTKGVL